MAQIQVLISLVFLASFVKFGECLQCHQCTSYTDAQCNDPFHYEPAREGEKPKPKTLEFLKDCPNDGKNYTLCRKIYQHVRDDVRIIRSCGYEKYEKGDCYKTVLEEYNTYVCQCEEDGCNSGHSLKMPLVVLAVSSALARLFH